MKKDKEKNRQKKNCTFSNKMGADKENFLKNFFGYVQLIMTEDLNFVSALQNFNKIKQ